MPGTRNPYPTEFREQMVALVRTGRSVESLAREYEPCAATIHEWVRQAASRRALGWAMGTRQRAHPVIDAICKSLFAPPSTANCQSAVNSRPRSRTVSPASSSSKTGTPSLAGIRLWAIRHPSTTKGLLLKGWTLHAHNRPSNRGNSNSIAWHKGQIPRPG